MSSAGSAGSAGRSSAVVGVAVLAAFTANLDLSIVNLALPVIGEAFGVGQSTLAWTVSAYVLPFAVSILAVGRLGDRYGHRRILAIGGLVFAAGALASALAPGYGVLLAGRVAQGIGGAALLTIGLAAISATFEGPARGRALGLYFAAGAIAAVIGPLVGGLLASLVGWQGIFWAQVPLARAGRRRRVDGAAARPPRDAIARSTARASSSAASCSWASTALCSRATCGAGRRRR